MTILELFIEFIDKFTSLKILYLEIINWLLIFAVIYFVFEIIKILGGHK
jgi:hypothetical protein